MGLEIKRLRAKWWVFTILSLILIAPIFFYTTGTELLSDLGQSLAALPDAAHAALGVSSTTDLTDFVQYQCFVLSFYYAFVALFACVLGGGALSSEIGKGTIGFLYARPVSRGGVVTRKLLANLFMLILHVLVVMGAAFALSYLVMPEVLGIQQVAIAIVTLAMGILLQAIMTFALGFWLSSMMQHAGETVVLAVVMTLVFAVLGVLARSISVLEMLAPFIAVTNLSPGFVYQAGIDPLTAGIAAGTTLFLVILSYMIYSRKNLAL
ncbi:MAG: ABC transporter permease [Christensenellales bacterium]|jgi:ABC-2 type transport system permease protein